MRGALRRNRLSVSQGRVFPCVPNPENIFSTSFSRTVPNPTNRPHVTVHCEGRNGAGEREVAGSHANKATDIAAIMAQVVPSVHKRKQKDDGAQQSKKKKRWHGDMSGGGAKTTMSVKRKPNWKDRERARIKLGISGGAKTGPAVGTTSQQKNAVQSDVRNGSHPKVSKKPAGPGKASGSGGGGGANSGVKRKFGDGSTPFDRADKHKQQKVPTPKPAPAPVPRPPPTVPRTERAQKIQELLRQKLAKSHIRKDASTDSGVSEVAGHQPAANADAIKDAVSTEAAQSEQETTRDTSLTVVQGKVATGKVSSNWQALRQDMKKQKRLEKKGKKGGSTQPSKTADVTPGAYLPTPLELINCVGPLGIDCEMVGVGDGGHRSVLARVSIVDGNGEVVMGILFFASAVLSPFGCRFPPHILHPQSTHKAPTKHALAYDRS